MNSDVQSQIQASPPSESVSVATAANPTESSTLYPIDIPHPHSKEKTFLNFTERKILNRAMNRLAVKDTATEKLVNSFAEYDKDNKGMVTSNQFIRTLRASQFDSDISSKEMEVLCKCYCPEVVENANKVYYKDFVGELSVKQKRRQACPYFID